MKVEITDKTGNVQLYDVRCSYLVKFVNPSQVYPVTYTIKQDGTKVYKNTWLLGKDLTENQIKIVAKIQNMALIDLTEKTSEMLELHMGLLFELLENTIEIWDEGDEGDGTPTDAPTPQPEDSRRF